MTLDDWLVQDECTEVGGREYVRQLYALAKGAKRIAEIGLGWGYSARAFMQALTDNGGGELVSIDPLDGLPDGVNVREKHPAPAGVTWTHLKQPSHRVPNLAASVDLLYIDGDPRYCLDDATRFYKDIRPGGLLVIDSGGWTNGPLPAIARLESLGFAMTRHPYSGDLFFAVHQRIR